MLYIYLGILTFASYAFFQQKSLREANCSFEQMSQSRQYCKKSMPSLSNTYDKPTNIDSRAKPKKVCKYVLLDSKLILKIINIHFDYMGFCLLVIPPPLLISKALSKVWGPCGVWTKHTTNVCLIVASTLSLPHKSKYPLMNKLFRITSKHKIIWRQSTYMT